MKLRWMLSIPVLAFGFALGWIFYPIKLNVATAFIVYFLAVLCLGGAIKIMKEGDA